MFPNVIADSAQLSTLAKVLNDFCAAHGITDEFSRNTVAHRLIHVFGEGAETEELLRAGLGDPALAHAAPMKSAA